MSSLSGTLCDVPGVARHVEGVLGPLGEAQAGRVGDEERRRRAVVAVETFAQSSPAPSSTALPSSWKAPSPGRCGEDGRWRGQLHRLHGERTQEERGPQQDERPACPRTQCEPKSPRHSMIPPGPPTDRSGDTRSIPVQVASPRRLRGGPPAVVATTTDVSSDPLSPCPARAGRPGSTSCRQDRSRHSRRRGCADGTPRVHPCIALNFRSPPDPTAVPVPPRTEGPGTGRRTWTDRPGRWPGAVLSRARGGSGLSGSA